MNTFDRLYSQQEQMLGEKEDILNGRAMLARTILFVTSINECRRLLREGKIDQNQCNRVRDWVEKINLTPIYLEDLPAEPYQTKNT